MGLFTWGMWKPSLEWRSRLPRCANQACQTSSGRFAITRRKQGIRMAEAWYCGPECFEAAASEKFAFLLAARSPLGTVHRNRMPLGLVLLSRGEVTSEELKVALQQQREVGGRIGDILLQRGFATQEQITAAAARQWGCPTFSLSKPRVEAPIRIPVSLLELYHMLPVHFVEWERKLLVGFVYGVEHAVLRAIEEIAQCVTVPCFITPEEHHQQLQRWASERQDEEVCFERMASSLEMARITRNYALQIEAEEARFSPTRDYLWVRLEGTRQHMDLLFRFQQQ